MITFRYLVSGSWISHTLVISFLGQVTAGWGAAWHIISSYNEFYPLFFSFFYFKKWRLRWCPACFGNLLTSRHVLQDCVAVEEVRVREGIRSSLVHSCCCFNNCVIQDIHERMQGCWQKLSHSIPAVSDWHGCIGFEDCHGRTSAARWLPFKIDWRMVGFVGVYHGVRSAVTIHRIKWSIMELALILLLQFPFYSVSASLYPYMQS